MIQRDLTLQLQYKQAGDTMQIRVERWQPLVMQLHNLIFASGVSFRVRMAAFVLASWVCQSAFSEPPPEELGGGFRPLLPLVESKVPPIAERSRAAISFIDSISKNDAMFELVLGQSRLIVLKDTLIDDDAAKKVPQSVIAVGNPDVVDFEVLGPRHIRVIGKQVGVTDLVVTGGNDQTFSYEVNVVYDLRVLQARIRGLFPDADVRLAQLGRSLVVEGQARDSTQIARILEVVRRGVLVAGMTGGGNVAPAAASPVGPPGMITDGDQAAPDSTDGPEVVNLLRVPGSQQVMLKVQIAELNRTALRQIGSDMLFANGKGQILGTKLNSVTTSSSIADGAGLLGAAATTVASTSPTTAFGIFDKAGFQILLSALRQNSLLKILAEPNLVAMNGHEARFLSGGEFPVPVPQSGAGGGPATITVQYKKFGVQLSFVPHILDGDVIRLSVTPEVSSIDFALGIELSGTRVPGLNTRNAHTVVELREGQTLAMAGLMQATISNQTSRIPGLGDLPFIGPFFSNTSGNKIEKELLVLVTPYLIEPMNCVPALPGDEVYEPNDLEFYLLGRLQGRTGHSEFRSTTVVDDPLHHMRQIKVECRNFQGPVGYSE